MDLAGLARLGHRPGRSGGHVLHNGVQLLDLAAWWLNAETESVYVQGRKETSADLEIYDYLSMLVRFHGGATAMCEMSCANWPRSFAYRDVELPWDAGQGLAFLEGGTSLLPGEDQTGFDREVTAWVAAMRGESWSPVTGQEARLEPGDVIETARPRASGHHGHVCQSWRRD